MEEFFKTEVVAQLKELLKLMDWIYFFVFILLSWTIKKTFGTNIKRKVTKWKTQYTVLIIATILAIPFVVYTESTWLNILISYAVGTSFYELILKSIETGIKKIFGKQ